MTWLKEFLQSVLSKMTTAILDHLRWLGNKIAGALAVLVAMILAPINWLIDRFCELLDWCTGALGVVTGYVGQLHFGDVGSYWESFAPYFSTLDLFIPLSFLTGTIAVLLLLWLTTLLIRFVVLIVTWIADVIP